ncbi:MAG: exo-alpha-sialidase [Cyclobacteriaceae bacterium]|nr:exo-alpha-sialidase [Cyclobacteriaceae bacterium]
MLKGNLLQAQFKNLVIAVETNGENPVYDPTISISRKNPKNIAVGVMKDKVIYTKDGGLSWKATGLSSSYGNGGNPVLVGDIKGELFYYHLADESNKRDRIVVHKSTDGGESWSDGEFLGYNPPTRQRYSRAAVHPRKQIVYATWTQFDQYGSTDANCHSNIMFSMSANGGKKWSKATQISQTPGNCADDDNSVAGAMPAVDQRGRVFVAWSNQGTIFMDRSFDGGTTWLTNDLGITKQEGGWSLNIPGFRRTHGMPVLVVDNSKGRLNGSIYLVWAGQQNSEDDTDIWFMRSTNQGDFWTQPLRINQDEAGKHQFLPALAVDDETGYIYIVYYDRRAYDDLQTDVYLAYSMDGGASFKEAKISEKPFTPSAEKGVGNYLGIDAYKGIIMPVWTRTDEGRTSVLTTIIKDTELIKK